MVTVEAWSGELTRPRPLGHQRGPGALWSTLAVEGPTETVGLHGRTWFEWSATVVVAGGEEISDTARDRAIPTARRPVEPVEAEDTAPQARAL